MRLRDAIPSDIPALTAIYAHHVANGTGTFEEELPTEPMMLDRLHKVQEAGWAWLVAEAEAADGDQGRILGYAYFTQFRDRSAYRFSAEDSIYVRNDVRGQGVGKALVEMLLVRAEAAGFRQMFAVIGDAENVGSIGLHLSLGFKQIGTLRSAGLKFGRWLDVVQMQRSLGLGDRGLPD